jgi:hypothetical protein
MVVAMINETMPALLEGRQAARGRLWDLLDEWMTLDETRATWEEVEALYHAIVAFWRADPEGAEESYRAWRTARSACRARPEGVCPP